jgi:hypothetical protein
MATFVLNNNYGGFTLSDEALKALGWHKHARYLVLETDARSDPELVRVCKKLGARASEDGKPFTFVEVASSDIPFVTLSEYDGIESLTIDTNAKASATYAQIIDAARAVLACDYMSAADKVSLITTILK